MGRQDSCSVSSSTSVDMMEMMCLAMFLVGALFSLSLLQCDGVKPNKKLIAHANLAALVGSLGGTTIFVASFVPDDGPYEEISTSPAEYIAQIKDVIVPNPVSGPGVITEAVDTDFFTISESESDFTPHTFHEFISQPLILTNGLCQRNPIYFNQTFTDAVFRNGTVTLYEDFPGVYGSVQGYSASGEMVGYNAESCSSAAANTDPNALA